MSPALRAELFPAEAGEIFQGRKGVFIDRVTMVKVADYKRINGLEFREQPGEQTQSVHVAQCLRGERLHQQAPEMLPELRRTEHPWLGGIDLRLHQLFGFAAQRQSVPRHHLKQAQKQGGSLARARGMAGEDAAPDHGKIGIRQARPPVLIKRVKTGAGGSGFIHELCCQSVDHPRLAEVDAHPVRRGQPLRRFTPMPRAAACA